MLVSILCTIAMYFIAMLGITCTSVITGCCCVTTPCCPSNGISKNLLLVLSGAGSSCNGNYTLVYNPVSSQWENFDAVGGCSANPPPLVTWGIGCNDNGDGACRWRLQVENDYATDMDIISCNPLHLRNQSGISQLITCGCDVGPTVDVFQI